MIIKYFQKQTRICKKTFDITFRNVVIECDSYGITICIHLLERRSRETTICYRNEPHPITLLLVKVCDFEQLKSKIRVRESSRRIYKMKTQDWYLDSKWCSSFSIFENDKRFTIALSVLYSAWTKINIQYCRLFYTNVWNKLLYCILPKKKEILSLNHQQIKCLLKGCNN